MWICPECGRKFSRNRQGHSCEQYDPEIQFIGKSQKAKDLYDLLIRKVQSFGGIEIHAAKWGITVRHLSTFLSLMIGKDHLTIIFLSEKQIDDFPVYASARHTANRWSNAIKIESHDEIDDQLMQWLRDAYDLAV
jgi:hypothetical protein